MAIFIASVLRSLNTITLVLILVITSGCKEDEKAKAYQQGLETGRIQGKQSLEASIRNEARKEGKEQGLKQGLIESYAKYEMKINRKLDKNYSYFSKLAILSGLIAISVAIKRPVISFVKDIMEKYKHGIKIVALCFAIGHLAAISLWYHANMFNIAKPIIYMPGDSEWYSLAFFLAISFVCWYVILILLQKIMDSSYMNSFFEVLYIITMQIGLQFSLYIGYLIIIHDYANMLIISEVMLGVIFSTLIYWLSFLMKHNDDADLPLGALSSGESPPKSHPFDPASSETRRSSETVDVRRAFEQKRRRRPSPSYRSVST